MIINTCNNTLRDEAREELVRMSQLESGRLLVLKLMFNIIVDVDASALQLPTQSLQLIYLKGIPGDNVSTVMAYLKEALVLLHNCLTLPTYTLGLLNDVICSASCDEFTRFMISL